MGRDHRNERSGALSGLVRVRQFTQDDAHLYCRPEQVQAEITDLLELVREWYGTFGLQPSYRVATRPPDKLGTEQQWDQAEEALHQALRVNEVLYEHDKGGGAFYGPKIDIDVEDALGRKWQLATIQVDLTMLPERMQCEYIDTDGKAKRPVVIHRAIFGSYERFVAILTEHFAGAFPTWLAPVQARVLPISEKHGEYGRKVFAALRAARHPRRARRPQREAGLSHPRRPGPQDAVHAGGGRARGPERRGEPAPSHGRRRGRVPLDQIVAELTAEIGSRSATLTVGHAG